MSHYLAHGLIVGWATNRDSPVPQYKSLKNTLETAQLKSMGNGTPKELSA